jgi:hydrogenase-1 operon protein HyaF
MDAVTGCPDAAARDGLVEAVLHELSALLAELEHDPGFSGAIDLHSLPMPEAARARLSERLGSGEVDVTLDLAGPSRVRETAYPGVWWLRHADGADRTLLEQIVVARVPELLCAQEADIAGAARRLAAELGRAAREGDPG